MAHDTGIEPLAVIGMSGRFPGARNVAEFWRNLRDGVESVTFFTDEELRDAGIPDAALSHPQYVKAKGILADLDCFDAGFFGYAPREAEAIDPQQRVFLEAAYAALEDAGYANPSYTGSIGVFAGSGLNAYLLTYLRTHPELLQFVGYDKDYLATRVSYKLDLKGPSLVVQSACSTSLVAVCQAAQSLLTYQCDLALAGGVSISLPDPGGYFYAEGAIFSPDGKCRAFDREAQGIVPGNGVGIVVLKRLQDAIADGDAIHALIRGFGVNNDGAGKIGYTAPSVEGQSQVVLAAQSLAGVDADTIGYLEAHGTATPLGDPVEIAALTRAFRASTDKTNFCAIGSVKTNIGHLDAAAGVAGLIKAVLALRHRAIPPSLHYEAPNPKIDFPSTPFYVNTALTDWAPGAHPRRAAVSSFGIGGTNAHLVLEEAPELEPSGPARPWQVLPISARTPAALDESAALLARHLAEAPAVSLPDAAFTLQIGRRVMAHRRAVVCRDLAGAAVALDSRDPAYTYEGAGDADAVSVAFMFPSERHITAAGLGELYAAEAAFRQAVDACIAAADSEARETLKAVVGGGGAPGPVPGTGDTVAAHLSIFCLEFALAKLWISWGVTPAAAIGDGVGEYAAASLSGALPLSEAVRLTVRRARALTDGSPAGAAARVDGMAGARRHPATIPFASCATGMGVEAPDLDDPARWAAPLGDTETTAAAIGELTRFGIQRFLVIGPAATFGDPVGRTCGGVAPVESLPAASAPAATAEALTRALAALWVAGVRVDWAAYHATSRRVRVQLPTYPFERQRLWITSHTAPVPGTAVRIGKAAAAERRVVRASDSSISTDAPVPASIAEHSKENSLMLQSRSRSRDVRSDVAIVGMAGRFPGASDLDTFWQNLRGGVESRTIFSDEELLAKGIPAAALRNPKYIRSGFVLDDIDLFDAAFFGINPREAELLDPQHRLFLECAWEALEHAGYDADTFPGSIGVFGGATLGSYLTANILRNSEVVQSVGGRQAVFGSVPDYMVTRVAYKLNLRGPAFFVQSACSTSLVAVHLAAQSLANHECDMVLAGGVSVTVPDRLGYMYEEGGMLSPDGVVRTFDADARGTIFGSGVGIIVLKRLDDAINDGDTIHAVIKGAAANNDGSLKVGFTAPGVVGQSRVVAEALDAAGVPAESINYVEAHGTGTELGDPIEIAALTRAFRASTDERGFCAVGSIKPNIGHLDAAAGVSSLIKTVLALKHRLIPPTINFERPNGKIEFDDSPFFVNTELTPWERKNGAPRRAGVSSFGFGGTNAHIVLEEAPEAAAADASRSQQVLLLSGRTEHALENATMRLADSLQRHAQPLADVAYTLAVGRRHFGQRRAIVCGQNEDPIETLRGADRRRVLTGVAAAKDRSVVFMFPGQGSQYVQMAADLYREEALFHDIVDTCAEILQPHLGLDLRAILYPASDEPAAAERLQQTSITQSALFTVEYALARLWMSWGIKPEAMLGHSIGELVAACLSGVFTLEDALALVALRGKLMEAMPPGGMAAVPLPADLVASGLGAGLWLAAANAPSLSVVSGEPAALDGYIQARAREGIDCRRLHTSHAFHSALMEGAVTAFADAVRRVERSAPTIPFVSNVTGTWITAAQAVDPEYWSTHIRQPVRFSEGVKTLLADSGRLLLEVGPGNTLSSLVRQQRPGGGHAVVSSLRHPNERASDVTTVLSAMGSLWVNGAAADWTAFYAGQRRRRVPLPSYPFERQRFWVEPEKFSAKKALLGISMLSRQDFSDWFHIVSWKRAPSHTPALAASQDPCLLFEDDGCSSRLAARLTASGRPVLRVRPGARFEQVGADAWTIAPGSREDLSALVTTLHRAGRLPRTIVHAWSFTGAAETTPDDAAVARAQDRGFYCLLFLAQALGEVAGSAPVHLGVIADGLFDVIGGEAIAPEKATLLGPCRVIPQESPALTCRLIDVSVAESSALRDEQVDGLLADALHGASSMVGYRAGTRWMQTLEDARLEPVADAAPARLRVGGTYLITGGFGGIGVVIAEYLARECKARLILTGRRGLPARDQWPALLSTGDEATRRRIETAQRLEALGGEVMAGEADATDEARMRDVVAQARARFGRIDGVIHSAGVAGGGVIQLKKKEVAAAVLAPKVTGTRILARVFADQPLDFMLLCSSLTALVGGPGQVDYCAANSYLDAFARQYHAQTGTFTVAVNWNAWREVGMAVDMNVPEDLRESLKGAMLAGGISNAQGLDAFRRILTRCADRQIAISPNDLALQGVALAFVDNYQTTEADRSGASEEQAAPAAKSGNASYHSRPSLQTPFVAPRNETEQKIAGVWQDLLGIEAVGINDNFFELGGHSLLAIQVMARVNATLKTDIPVAKLYDGLTVAFLASVVGAEGQPAAPAADDDETESAERRKEQRARRQREQQARRRGATREIAST